MKSSFRTIAVVGAGTMGLGIAQVCAAAGFTTLLYDVRKEQLTQALRTIDKNLSLAVEKGKLDSQFRLETLLRIKLIEKLSDLKADLVIEAAVEKLDIKQNLFAELEKINGGKTILGTNTSSIPVTQIAQNLNDKSRCIGLHFFNPADRMKLVEIISGIDTDPRVVELLKIFAEDIGKTAVMAKDSPGFIVNRVARHFYVESLLILEQKRAPISVIDELLKSTGFKMGPFELIDLIGVDTNLAVTTSVYDGFDHAPRFRPNKIQQQMVTVGALGRKSGKGFYDYSK